MTPEKDNENAVRPLERLAVTLGIAITGAIVVWDGTRQAGASSYFPIAIGSAVVALSGISLAKLGREIRETDEAPLVKGFVGLALLAAFIAMSSQVGFLTASAAFIPAMALLGGDRSVFRIAIGTFAFIIMAYLIFGLAFAQPMPAELIFGGWG